MPQPAEFSHRPCEGLIENEPLSTEYLRGLGESAGNTIEQLEALAEMPDGRMQ